MSRSIENNGHGRRSVRRRFVAAAAALTIIAAATPAVANAGGGPGPAADRSGDRWLQEVVATNAGYHRVAAAEQAGYRGDIVPDCMDNPDKGGMGVHWISMDLLTDGMIIPDQPEALVYELDARGEKHLVAVEWVMPPNGEYPGPTAEDPGVAPLLHGHVFTWHPMLHVWKLHAWLFKANPSGMFADYNPLVGECPAA